VRRLSFFAAHPIGIAVIILLACLLVFGAIIGYLMLTMKKKDLHFADSSSGKGFNRGTVRKAE